MKRPLIKAGQLTNLTDARYYAALEVEWLGFLFEENNAHALSIEAFRAIKSWVEGPKIIAEIGFISNPNEYVSDIYDEVDGFQVSAFLEVPQKWYDDQKVVIREIKSIEQLSDSEMIPTQNDQDSLLIDLGGAEIPAILLNAQNAIFDVTLVGDELIQWVEKNNPFGIQVKGGDEEKVGFKSYDDIDAFFEFFEHSV